MVIKNGGKNVVKYFLYTGMYKTIEKQNVATLTSLREFENLYVQLKLVKSN